jgi:uncharacterized protein
MARSAFISQTPAMRYLLACLLLFAAPLAAQINLPQPADRQFVADHANLVDAADEEAIRKLCDKLLTDKATPIIVITIESMSRHTSEDLSIEEFARRLFNQWGIGYAELNGQQWNSGMLLLVSKLDRKAYIEFGAGLGHTYDAKAQQIMDTLIIPEFKAGRFSTGIRQGVEGLDQVARGLEVPRPPTPIWVYVVIAVGIGLMIFTVVSLVRRGSSGWAWLFWGAVFAIVGALLYSALTRRSGGGFSGGSFGGGFSGGGGASGSW